MAYRPKAWEIRQQRNRENMADADYVSRVNAVSAKREQERADEVRRNSQIRQEQARQAERARQQKSLRTEAFSPKNVADTMTSISRNTVAGKFDPVQAEKNRQARQQEAQSALASKNRDYLNRSRELNTSAGTARLNGTGNAPALERPTAMQAAAQIRDTERKVKAATNKGVDLSAEATKKYKAEKAEAKKSEEQKKWEKQQEDNRRLLAENQSVRELVEKMGQSPTGMGVSGVINPAYYKYKDELARLGYDAESLRDTLTRMENEERMAAREEKARQFGKEHPVLGTAASVGAGLLSSAGSLEAGQAAVDTAKGNYRGIDTNAFAYAPQRISQALREGASENINSGVGKFAYNTAGTMADMLAQMGAATVIAAATGGTSIPAAAGSVAAEGLYLTNMALSAAADSAADATERGASTQSAIATGVASGVLTAACEKIGFDKVFKPTAFAGGTSRQALQNVLRNSAMAFLAEGSEEAAEDIGNIVADEIISHIGGHSSEYGAMYDGYIAQGLAPEDAMQQVIKAAGAQIGTDFAAGGIAGGIIGGANSAVQASRAVRESRQNGSQSPQNSAETSAVDLSLIDENALTRQQRGTVRAIDRMLSDVGGKVHLYSSEFNSEGQAVYSRDIPGKAAAGQQAENGFYDPTTGDIYIDINAGDNGEGAITYAFSHELAHQAAASSPEMFGKLRSFMEQNYNEAYQAEGVEGTFADRARQMVEAGEAQTLQQAEEELVARGVESMFTDGRLQEKIDKLKSQDRSLWENLKAFFQRLRDKLLGVYRTSNGISAEGTMIARSASKIDAISRMFADALVDANGVVGIPEAVDSGIPSVEIIEQTDEFLNSLTDEQAQMLEQAEARQNETDNTLSQQPLALPERATRSEGETGLMVLPDARQNNGFVTFISSLSQEQKRQLAEILAYQDNPTSQQIQGLMSAAEALGLTSESTENTVQDRQDNNYDRDREINNNSIKGLPVLSVSESEAPASTKPKADVPPEVSAFTEVSKKPKQTKEGTYDFLDLIEIEEAERERERAEREKKRIEAIKERIAKTPEVPEFKKVGDNAVTFSITAPHFGSELEFVAVKSPGGKSVAVYDYATGSLVAQNMNGRLDLALASLYEHIDSVERLHWAWEHEDVPEDTVIRLWKQRKTIEDQVPGYTFADADAWYGSSIIFGGPADPNELKALYLERPGKAPKDLPKSVKAAMGEEEQTAPKAEKPKAEVPAEVKAASEAAEKKTAADGETAGDKTEKTVGDLYRKINEDAARRAKEANSFSDYVEGSATAAYRKQVDRAVEIAESQKARVSEEYHAKIDSLLDSYARKLADNLNHSYEIDARVPSVMVAGPANFPVRAKEKQNAARDRNMREYQDIQGILDKIRGTGTGGIMSDDKNAIKKLEAKLESLEALQTKMKAVNAYFRKHKTLEGCTELNAVERKELESRPDYQNAPFPSWALTNNNANIRRVKERITTLQKEAERAEQSGGAEAEQGEGYELKENHELGRIQFIFDGKPDEKTRALLKSNGFKWAPSQGAWQRMLNENGRHAAQSVRKALSAASGKAEVPAEVKAAAETKASSRNSSQYVVGTKFEPLAEKYGYTPNSPNSARNVIQSKRIDKERRTHQGAATAAGSAFFSDKFAEELNEAAHQDINTYYRRTDKGARNAATQRMQGKSLDECLTDWQSMVTNNAHGNKDGVTYGILLANKLDDAGRVSDAVDVMLDVEVVTGNAAQILQSAHIVNAVDGTVRVKFAEKLIKQIQREVAQRYSWELAGSLNYDKSLAEKAANAKDADARRNAIKALYESVAEQLPDSFMSKITAWRYLSMLGNLKTHLRNVGGNTTQLLASTMKDVIGTGLERAVIRKQGKRTKSLKMFDPKLLKFGMEDYKTYSQTVDTGAKYSDDIHLSGFQKPFGRKTFGSKKLSKALNFLTEGNGKILTAEDNIFLRINYAQALAGYMGARGLKPSDTSAYMDAAREYAMEQAVYNTFHEANALADLITEAEKNLRSKARDKGAPRGRRAAAKLAEVAIEGVAPFKTTPANIVKTGIDYSPIGIMEGLVGLYDSVKNKNVSAAEYLDKFASGLTGTGLFMLGAYLAAKGLVRGGMDKREDEEDKLAGLNGSQEYAIEADGKSYTIDWVTPASIPFFTGVELMNALQKDGSDDALQNVVGVLLNVSEPILNLSMMQGLKEIIEGDSTGSKKGVVASKAEALVGSYFTQFVPTFLGQTARMIDPYSRQRYVESGTNPAISQAQKIGQSIINRIPGLSMTGKPYVDAWGRKEKTGENLATRAVQQYISPGYYNKMGDPVTDAIIQLGSAAPKRKGDIYPSVPAKKVTVNGTDYRLNADEYTALQMKAGNAQYEVVNDYLIEGKKTPEVSFYANGADGKRHMYTFSGNLQNAKASNAVCTLKTKDIKIDKTAFESDEDFRAFILDKLMEQAYEEARDEYAKEYGEKLKR